MATVRELSDLYSGALFNPLPPTADRVCSHCLGFANVDAELCYQCWQHQEADSIWADLVVPISYAAERPAQQLYRMLRGYKGSLSADAAQQLRLSLAAILWRWIETHESCLTTKLELSGFDLVATVPSSDRQRDELHPLRRIVGDMVTPLAPRYERLLRRSEVAVENRIVDPRKYESRALEGEAVLLVEDSWVTGANVESAAGALKEAGAGIVTAVVLGRVLDLSFRDTTPRFNALPSLFDWDWCPYHVLF